METVLQTPETILCMQDEELNNENDVIYFISKGKCKVTVKDKFNDRYEEKEVRILNPGMHFGVSTNINYIIICYYIFNIGNKHALQMQKNSECNIQ